MAEEYSAVEAFAARCGLVFSEPHLLRMALTHRSYLNEHPELDWEDNERLEYLGDAVIDFLLAEHLFLSFPEAREGGLTALRAALVRRSTLARFADQLGIGEALFMGHGEIETGGRARAATLCGAFEAVVGALYLDQGIAGASAFVMPLMQAELSLAQAEVFDKDPKSRLQELAQARLGVTPRYRTVKAEGPDHAKLFTVEVAIAGVVCGVGDGPGKQSAAQQAALAALARQEAWTATLSGAASDVAEELQQPFES
jgi:ribonuclease-3